MNRQVLETLPKKKFSYAQLDAYGMWKERKDFAFTSLRKDFLRRFFKNGKVKSG